MSLQKLCYLVNEKNKLAAQRTRARSALNRLKKVKRARAIDSGMQMPSPYEHSTGDHYKGIAQRWFEMLERDFRVVYMEAELIFNTANLNIAKHTQKYTKETNSLRRELNARINYNVDNNIKSIDVDVKEDELGSRSCEISLKQDQIEEHAMKHEFELIFLQSM